MSSLSLPGLLLAVMFWPGVCLCVCVCMRVYVAVWKGKRPMCHLLFARPFLSLFSLAEGTRGHGKGHQSSNGWRSGPIPLVRGPKVHHCYSARAGRREQKWRQVLAGGKAEGNSAPAACWEMLCSHPPTPPPPSLHSVSAYLCTHRARTV